VRMLLDRHAEVNVRSEDAHGAPHIERLRDRRTTGPCRRR
jgi:hypothetical protein